jgi:hypothetical protein
MGRKSDGKERLLQAILDLMCQSSYGTLTIDAICERAGVKKGYCYNFSNLNHNMLLRQSATDRRKKAENEHLFR